MPIKWLLHPKTNKPLSFEDAPSILEEEGLMPSYAVQVIIDENNGEDPSFNVRPSDVQLGFTCRRQRVWMTNHDYGINPLDAEGMLEGSALHEQLGAHEIVVPLPKFTDQNINDFANGITINERENICGVPMRGRIDWLFDDRIEDLKTTTPYWIGKYPPKGSENRWPIATIWEKDSRDVEDIEKWKIQLSIYSCLLQKSGQEAPSRGRVWRRYGGVKAEHGRWKRFDFDLLTEEQLEAQVGPWVRELAVGLTAAETDPDAWKNIPSDGRSMVGSKGNMWQCDKCPFKEACFLHDNLEVF